MPHLEPSYLRYIYDGLEKGELHPDNAAALPEGLTGLYEATFEDNKPARERQKLLETFAIWALLKKEVSAQFVAEILDVPSQEIDDFIATYSSWFTSPESGKYQLYHERLKVYLLQKLSEQEIATLHNKLVTRLEQALAEQKQDDFEMYGLEFLSVHYFTTAMITGDGKKLISFSYGQNHWQRQLKLSKGFEWTKKALNLVMTWASKFNEEEVIECGLKMVDLHHQEQNDAPQIVALVTNGDIEAALKRIEAFGGYDKEGLQRKFTLYMLCLMELTHLKSKDKPFNKGAIEKILKHFDENLPIDHSILNWDDFFSSHLIFLIAFQLNKLDLNFLIVFKRTDYWDLLWINFKFNLTYFEIDVLLKCTTTILNERKKCSALCVLSSLCNKNGFLEDSEDLLNKALGVAKKMSFGWKKEEALFEISTEFAKQMKTSEAIKIANSINKNHDIFLLISNQFIDKGNIKDSFNFVKLLDNSIWEKKNIIMKISIEYAKLGKVEQGLDILNNIIDDCWERVNAILIISKRLRDSGDEEKSDFLINEAIDIAYRISDNYWKSFSLIEIADELDRLNNNLLYEKIKSSAIQEAINIADIFIRKDALFYIYSSLRKKGNVVELDFVMSKVLDIANGNIYFPIDVEILKDICIELSNQGLHEESLKIFKELIKSNISSIDEDHKNQIFHQISLAWMEQGILKDALEIVYRICNKQVKSYAFNNICNILLKKNRILDAFSLVNDMLVFTSNFTNNSNKDIIITSLSRKFVKQDLIRKSLFVSNFIHDEYWKIANICEISSELNNRNKKLGAYITLQNAIKINQQTKNIENKDMSLQKISIELSKLDKFDKAWKVSNEIFDIWDKIRAFMGISTEMYLLGNIKDANFIMNEALKLIKSDEELLSIILIKEMAFELIKQGKIIEAKNNIKDGVERISILLKIYSAQIKAGRKDEAEIALIEAYNFVHKLDNEIEKSDAYKNICDVLLIEGKIDESLKFAKKLSSDSKCIAFVYISKKMAEKGRIEDAVLLLDESIQIALELISESSKNRALKCISSELSTQGNWNLSEKIGKMISKTDGRQISWKKLAYNITKTQGLNKALHQVNQLQSNEARLFYLKGWIDEVEINELTPALKVLAIRHLKNDTESIEKILQLHAIQTLFFHDVPEQKIKRLNRTLNIQWAIDIKNQLPN